jgi:hypothetical protein
VLANHDLIERIVPLGRQLPRPNFVSGRERRLQLDHQALKSFAIIRPIVYVPAQLPDSGTVLVVNNVMSHHVTMRLSHIRYSLDKKLKLNSVETALSWGDYSTQYKLLILHNLNSCRPFRKIENKDSPN